MHFIDKEVDWNLKRDTRQYRKRENIKTNKIKAQIDHLNIALIDTINQINCQDLKLSSSDYKAFISHVQSFAQNLRSSLSEIQVEDSESQFYKDIIRVCSWL